MDTPEGKAPGSEGGPADDLFPKQIKLTMDMFQGPAAATPADARDARQAATEAKMAGKAGAADPFVRRPLKEWRAQFFKFTLLPTLLVMLAWMAYSVFTWRQWHAGAGDLGLTWAALAFKQEYVATYLLFNIALTTVVAMLAARLAGVTPGRLHVAVLRLAAAGAVAWVVGEMVPLNDPWFLHVAVGAAARFILMWLLLTWLFEIDLLEGMIWTFFISIAQLGLALMLIWTGMSLAYQMQGG